jgi:hypothetical protein
MRTGQALVVILLVMAVALTVGLAVVSRSITEVGISTTQKESAQALANAEAGIEQALAGNVSLPSGVTSVPVGGNNEVSIPEPLVAGESVTIFLAGHTAAGDLDTTVQYAGADLGLCWGQDDVNPAVEVTVYYKSGANYLVSRTAVDPNANRAAQNNFSTTDNNPSCPSGKTYQHYKKIAMPVGTLLMMRVRLLYNQDTPQYLAVKGSSAIPIQGQDITAVGSQGQTSRKVQVFQRYPDLSPILDTAVFSGTSLTK